MVEGIDGRHDVCQGAAVAEEHHAEAEVGHFNPRVEEHADDELPPFHTAAWKLGALLQVRVQRT